MHYLTLIWVIMDTANGKKVTKNMHHDKRKDYILVNVLLNYLFYSLFGAT